MYITTYSGIHFTPLEPKAEEILIEDIAHAQSLMTRANGHFPEFYSVAQHSIACAEEAMARGCDNRIVLACLIHDASEAYLSDVTRPVKTVLKEYKNIERTLQDAIYTRFLGDVPSSDENAIIEEIDDTCLYYEFLHYMGEELACTAPEKKSEMEFVTLPFKEVENEFLRIFHNVCSFDNYLQFNTLS